MTLEFFSITTDERLQKKWSRSDLKTVEALLREALYVRNGSTTTPPAGFQVADIEQLRETLRAIARERHGDTSSTSLSRVREYFEGEIGVCRSAMGYMA